MSKVVSPTYDNDERYTTDNTTTVEYGDTVFTVQLITKKDRLLCPQEKCQNRYETEKQLKLHLNNSHGFDSKKTKTCPICSKTFVDYASCRKTFCSKSCCNSSRTIEHGYHTFHAKLVTEKNHLVCPIDCCKCRFDNEQNLKIHISIKHGLSSQKEKVCEYCSTIFTDYTHDSRLKYCSTDCFNNNRKNCDTTVHCSHCGSFVTSNEHCEQCNEGVAE